MKKIKLEETQNAKFELVIQIRDRLGNPTGKTKSFKTDNAEELDNFWERNIGTKNKFKDEKTNKKKGFKNN